MKDSTDTMAEPISRLFKRSLGNPPFRAAENVRKLHRVELRNIISGYWRNQLNM